MLFGKYLDVNIGHLTTKDIVWLSAVEGEKNPPFRFCSHDNGFIVFVPGPDFVEEEACEAAAFGLSDSFTAIFRMAAAMGCNLIDFDEDGFSHPEFPIHL